jgi:hypothetical protein
MLFISSSNYVKVTKVIHRKTGDTKLIFFFFCLEPLVGSVIVRFNASLETKAISQRIAIDTTALVLVETASSLSAYPILSKERRRQIPSGMDGLLLLLRQKKVLQ